MKLPTLNWRNALIGLYAIAVVILFGVVAASAVKVVGVDGISYIEIAHHYADGHWKEAVNAYWSPMLSWLLVPFVAAGITGEVAFRIIAVAVSLATLALGQRLVSRHTDEKVISTAVYQVSMLLFLLYVLKFLVMSDLLVVFWATCLAVVLSEAPKPFEKPKGWLIGLGILGGIGFLIKVILLPVFIVSTAIWFLLLSDAPKRFKLSDRLKRLVVPFLVLAVIVSAWAIPLSFKYEKLTLSSSGEYSMAFIGPHSIKHPVSHGLVAPPHRFAVNPWEDPANYSYVQWSPLKSIDDFRYYIEYILKKNIPDVISVLNMLSPFIVGALWVAVLLLVTGKISRRERSSIMATTLISLIFILAYCASHVSGGGRYLWPVLMMSILLVALLLGSVKVSAWKGRLTVWTAGAIFILISFPYWQPLHTDHAAFYGLSQRIKEVVPAKARFASNSADTTDHIAYFANLTGYGFTLPGRLISDPLVQQDLKENKIDYYLFIQDPDRPIDLKGYNVIFTTKIQYDRTKEVSLIKLQ